CWRSRPRDRGLFCKDCFGETPKVRVGLAFARETRALPGILARWLLRTDEILLVLDVRKHVPPPNHTPPYRRCLFAKSSTAANKSFLVKSGHSFGVTYISLYESCQSRKFDKRISPDVRMSKSGSG